MSQYYPPICSHTGWPRSGRTPSVFRENLCSRQWGPYRVTGYWCHMKPDLKVRPFHPLHVNELSDADMNARKDSVPNVPVVQCSSQMSVLSIGVCILETLSLGLRRTPIFTKSWREPHLTLWCGLVCNEGLIV
jgi:hypothetical protein